MIALGGLLIFAILILIVATVAFAISRRMKAGTNFCIIAGYLVVLIGLWLICLQLPARALVKSAPQKPGADAIANTDIRTRIAAGNFISPPGFTKTETRLTPQGGRVTLQSEEGGTVQVYLATKDVDAPDNGDGKIDIYCYRAAIANYCGTDFMPAIAVPTVSYSGNQLAIKEGSKSFVYYEFYDGYGIGQLLDNDDDPYSSVATISVQVFILLPPCVRADGRGYEMLAESSE